MFEMTPAIQWLENQYDPLVRFHRDVHTARQMIQLMDIHWIAGERPSRSEPGLMAWETREDVYVRRFGNYKLEEINDDIDIQRRAS